jgi:hypothetical protein
MAGVGGMSYRRKFQQAAAAQQPLQQVEYLGGEALVAGNFFKVDI